MDQPLFFAVFGMINQMWYAAPLVVVISLVYAATRHEDTRVILGHAARLAIWITGFMVAVFAALALVSWWV